MGGAKMEKDIPSTGGELREMATFHMATLDNEIKMLKDYIERLQQIREQYEALLIATEKRTSLAPSHPVSPPASQPSTISFRSAVRQVIESHPDQCLSLQEIFEEVTMLGARTNAKKPLNIVDFVLYHLKNDKGLPLERQSGGLWCWQPATNVPISEEGVPDDEDNSREPQS